MTRLRTGFTLLEVLVSAVLLGMMAALLASLMNQSSTAWAVGEERLIVTDGRRTALAEASREAAAKLRTSEGAVRLLSAWDGLGAVRTGRPFVRLKDAEQESQGAVERPLDGVVRRGRSTHVLAEVSSAGPDCVWGTEDDLIVGGEETPE